MDEVFGVESKNSRPAVDPEGSHGFAFVSQKLYSCLIYTQRRIHFEFIFV